MQFDLLSGPRPDLPNGDRRERRGLPPGNPAGASNLVLEGSPAQGFSLEVRFQGPTRFEVRPGADPRRITIAVYDPKKTDSSSSSVSGYAVQIYAGPAAQGLPHLDPDSVPAQATVYTLQHRRQGQNWIRVRVGFFASRDKAEQARRQLAGRYPGAWVTPATRAEHRTVVQTTAKLPTRPADDEAPLDARPEAADRKQPARLARPAFSSVGDPEVAGWIQSGRDYLTNGRPEQAIPLFTKAVSLPPHALSADAKELLGVARERNHQLAHAKAEYEEYLVLDPEGEGAARVRQRLDALLTAAKPDREALPAPPVRPPIRLDYFGTLASFYRLDRRSPSGLETITSESSLDNDLFLSGRARLESVDIRSELSGSFLTDFTDGYHDEARVRRVYLEAKQRGGPWSGRLGRTSPRGNGIIERYDGLGVRYGFLSDWGVSVVGGFPVDIFGSNAVSFDRRFVGVDIDFQLGPSLSVDVFSTYYDADGFVDRLGVGGELRYFSRDLSFTGLVDFDAYYQVLNTAFVTGSWQLTDGTQLNMLVDHRNSPILRTRNALIGQVELDVGDLPFDREEIERLARDRTFRSTAGSVGVNHRIKRDLLLSADFSVSHLTSTDASGDVLGTDSYGPEYGIFAQLLANDWLMIGDIALAGVRIHIGDPTNLVALTLEGRYPLLPGFRLSPRLNLDYRDTGNSQSVSIEPTLLAEYRFGDFTFYGRFQYLWRPSIAGAGIGFENGYALSAGLRYDL
ncbi:MAG: SPOR domain-containing protein [Myxococcota bacterium]